MIIITRGIVNFRLKKQIIVNRNPFLSYANEMLITTG